MVPRGVLIILAVIALVVLLADPARAERRSTSNGPAAPSSQTPHADSSASAARVSMPPLPFSPRAPQPRSLEASIRAAWRAAEDEKQRVPKPPPPEPRRKPRQPAEPEPPEAEESEDGSCLDACFLGLIGSWMGGSDEPEAAAAAAPGMAWAPGSQGEIHSDEPVPAWDGAGGAGAARNQVGVFLPRTRVEVLEVNASAAGLWLRVRPLDADWPTGWIDSAYLGPFAQPEASMEEPKPPLAPERWSAWLAVGGGLVGPADLNIEYGNGGFRLEGQFLWSPGASWQIGAGLGFRNFEGTPRVLYLTPATIEEPSQSNLQTLDVGLRAGQRFGAGSRGTRFTWLIGGGAVLVHESAEVHVFSTSTAAEIDVREDALSRWGPGGDLRLAVGWPVSDGAEIGLLVGGWIVGWTSEEKLSLTTDFLEESQIHGFEASLYVAFSGR
jgi:hypothetical protein